MSILVHTLQVHLIVPEKLRGKMHKRIHLDLVQIQGGSPVLLQEVTSVFCLLLLKFY